MSGRARRSCRRSWARLTWLDDGYGERRSYTVAEQSRGEEWERRRRLRLFIDRKEASGVANARAGEQFPSKIIVGYFGKPSK